MSWITLTSDFGTADGYVGAMKGVIACLCPHARVVDITHDVPRHDIAHAAYVVAQVAPRFPDRTIHVVVVDPGVGSDRKAVVIDDGRRLFVGPDNGVFELAVRGPHICHAIARKPFLADRVSATFHGRDIFATAAAALASGAHARDAGPVIEAGGMASASGPRVLHIDVFGNLITNLSPEDLGGAAFRVGSHRFDTLLRTYSDVPDGEPLAYVGSAGTIEVAVNGGSAAEMLGIQRGAPVEPEDQSS